MYCFLCVDHGGRYSYNQQPNVCKWNCMKLADALKPLVALEELVDIVKLFDDESVTTYYNIMYRKVNYLLGIFVKHIVFVSVFKLNCLCILIYIKLYVYPYLN